MKTRARHEKHAPKKKKIEQNSFQYFGLVVCCCCCCVGCGRRTVAFISHLSCKTKFRFRQVYVWILAWALVLLYAHPNTEAKGMTVHRGVCVCVCAAASLGKFSLPPSPPINEQKPEKSHRFKLRANKIKKNPTFWNTCHIRHYHTCVRVSAMFERVVVLCTLSTTAGIAYHLLSLILAFYLSRSYFFIGAHCIRLSNLQNNETNDGTKKIKYDLIIRQTHIAHATHRITFSFEITVLYLLFMQLNYNLLGWDDTTRERERAERINKMKWKKKIENNFGRAAINVCLCDSDFDDGDQ